MMSKSDYSTFAMYLVNQKFDISVEEEFKVIFEDDDCNNEYLSLKIDL